MTVIGYWYEGPYYDYPDTLKAGKALIRNRYLNLQPFVGKRVCYKKVDLDITAELDFGVGLSSREKAVIISSAGKYIVTTKRPLPTVDFRPRLNLTGYYRAFGLSLGYSHGITNYSAGQYGNRPEVYSRMWRIGVAYRLGKPV